MRNDATPDLANRCLLDNHRSTHFLSAKLRAGSTESGQGRYLIATELIMAKEMVVFWGGQVIDRTIIEALPEMVRRLQAIQVSDDLFLMSPDLDDPADFLNHSCDPNLGVFGSNALVAMRDILPGEMLCYDYAMTDSSTFDEFECLCGATSCRGQVTGRDWMNPALQRRYRGFFSSYLQRRIERLEVM